MKPIFHFHRFTLAKLSFDDEVHTSMNDTCLRDKMCKQHNGKMKLFIGRHNVRLTSCHGDRWLLNIITIHWVYDFSLPIILQDLNQNCANIEQKQCKNNMNKV